MKDTTNFFKKFITSIYDLKVFSKYAKEGFFRSIIYALLISIIFGGIKGIAIGYKLNKEISNIVNELKSDKYGFSIDNGMLNINKSPIKFEEEKSLIYIDKEKTIDEDEQLKNITVHQDLNILVLKDGIVVNNPVNKFKISYINMFKDQNVDSYLLSQEVKFFQIMIVLLSCIFIIFIELFDLLINCLIVVAFASLISIFMKMVVKYSALYSIILYASTLPLIIQTILEVLNPNVNLDTVFIVGTLTYTILILRYIKIDIIENMNKGKLNK